jgi:hypothetical protein
VTIICDLIDDKDECTEHVGVGDLTMNILYDWAKGMTNTSTNQLPKSLSGLTKFLCFSIFVLCVFVLSTNNSVM